ncbi:hypothetical protein [uncultured Erythrobacter sp.]|uniref:hypothetical protein n=1 Tax=uncultured Erythrobacter sp. TaxID=263913 RepID=UPI00261FA24C|nr:hypothetical protein [uncultured Erythrobacter sp.]
MSFTIKPVFVLDLDAWAAELEFTSGHEFLVGLDQGQPAIVWFDGEGVCQKLRLDLLSEGISAAGKLVLEENARDNEQE